METKVKRLFGKITSVLLIACLLMGGGILEIVDFARDGIVANAAYGLVDGGTVYAGQTATITCNGYAAWQLTNFIFESQGNTIGKVSKYDRDNNLDYEKEICGGYYSSPIMCEGGTRFVFEIYYGAINIEFNTANTGWPNIEFSNNGKIIEPDILTSLPSEITLYIGSETQYSIVGVYPGYYADLYRGSNGQQSPYAANNNVITIYN